MIGVKGFRPDVYADLLFLTGLQEHLSQSAEALKAVRAGFPYADRYTRDFVEGTISTAISNLERDLALAHIDKITFDFDTFDLCWTYKQDGDPMFDPDTCEMVHRSTDIHRCSMLDTTLDRFANSARNDILEYDSIMELPTT